MKRHVASLFVSNILLFGFAVTWLVLIFIPLLIASNHSMGLWYENNLAILTMEAAVCAFSIGWSVSKIIYCMKRSIAKLRWRRRQLCHPMPTHAATHQNRGVDEINV